jgi:hypothetical protein
MMGGLSGGVGSAVGGAMQAEATKEATQMQVDALKQQRDFVYSELEPNKVNEQALAADQAKATNRLALQGQTDPTMLAQRYASGASIADQAAKIGNSTSDAVAQIAAQEGAAGIAGMQDTKTALIDAALKQLNAGATLPPDVQAQLVQTGLENAGQMSGSASAKGFGGNILRKILGTAGIELQMKREEQAANLATQAQNLEASRQNILQGLFPNLQNQQLKNLAAQQDVLKQSDAMIPQAGLSGTDVANIWLARVGATNKLDQSAANVAAQGATNSAQALSSAIGSGSKAVGSMIPALSSGWSSLFGSSADTTSAAKTTTPTYGTDWTNTF